MTSKATPATPATTTEQPFASFEVKWSTRPGTYVPISVIDRTPDWVSEIAAEHHGNHRILSGTEKDCWCVVFVSNDRYFTCRSILPPGDWLIYYNYDHDTGTHDHQLCVAARITPQ